MDKSLTSTLGDGLVNQQNLEASNSFNSSSVSQMGTSYFGVNTVERPIRDNKSLPYFDVKASEERPSVFLDGQETSDSDPSSKDAGKTFDSPTTSERIPDTAPYQTECTDKPSAIADPLLRSVKFTYKHAIIERLQHGEKFSTKQLYEAIMKQYPNYSIKMISIKQTFLRDNGRIFKYVSKKNKPSNKHIRYWHMTESAMKDMKIAIRLEHTTHKLVLPRVSQRASCKNAIIECLLEEEKMTTTELFKKMKKKNQDISEKPAFSKSWINDTLVTSKEFEHSGSCRNNHNKMTRYWSINKREKDNIINSLSKDIETKSYKEILIELLKNEKELRVSQIKQNFKKGYPQRAALDTRWKINILSPLKAKRTCFERVPNEKGVVERNPPWRIKKDTNEYRESAIMVENEKSKSENATPAIIQPCLPLIASLGVEPKDDREDMQSILDQALDMQENTQHRASPSGQATLNAEQILALQPESPPVQFCSGIGLPLIFQKYEVAIEFEDL